MAAYAQSRAARASAALERHLGPMTVVPDLAMGGRARNGEVLGGLFSK